MNSQKDKMEVSFTFAIGSGDERKTYRAERSYRRNKDRLNSVIPKGSRFMELGTEGEIVVADGQTEVNRIIQEIIGLNMTDFTRSVVLPQGEFAQFLKLRDAERDQMIERIFSLGEYGTKLTEKVKEERNRLARELEQVEGVLKGIGDISPEQIAQVQSELITKKTEQQNVALVYETAETAYQKAAEVWKSQEALETVGKELEELNQQQPQIDLQRILLRKAEAAQRVKPYEDAWRKAEESLHTSREQLQNSFTELEAAQTAHQETVAEKTRRDMEYQEKQPVLIELRTRLLGLLDEESILKEKASQQALLLSRQEEIRVRNAEIQGRLQKGEDYKLKKEAERQEIEAGLQALMVDSVTRENVFKGVALTEEYRRALTDAAKLEERLKEETNLTNQLAINCQAVETERGRILVAVQQVQQDLERRQAAKPGDLAVINRQNESLRRLEQQIDSLMRLDEELQCDRGEMTQLTATVEQKPILIGKLRHDREECRQKTAARETEIEKLELERKRIETENYAAVLAGNLQTEAPCPVCGSTHHPNLAQKHESAEFQLIADELEAAKSQVIDLREKLETLNQELIKNETAHEGETNQLNNLREKIRLKENNYANILKGLPAELTTYTSSQLKIYLAEKQNNFRSLFQAIETWDQEIKTLTDKLAKIAAQKNNLDTELGNLKGQLTAGENRLARLNQEYAAQTGMVIQKKNALADLQQTLQISDFPEKQAQILAQDRQRDSLQENLKVVAGQLDKVAALLLELRQEAERLDAEARELKISEAALEREIGERQTKIAAAVGSRSVREVFQETEESLAILRQRVEQIANQFTVSQERVNQLSSKNSADQRQADIAVADFETAIREMQDKLHENGFINTLEYQDSLRENHECEAIRQKIQEFEDRRQRAVSRFQDIHTQLNGANISAAEWEKTKQRKDELAARKDWIAGEIGGLEMNLQTMESQYRNMQQYLEQRRAIARRKDMAEEIAKLLQGNAFVAYIAEEHMQYILADASARLAALTNGRYVLQMDEKKDFIICDYGNGGLTRPVTSLSGGETFLVSLSLALALSSKIQLGGRNPLEFFFLDEGFGTLDPVLLDTVMDSLERLQKESFTIGIISHVPELRERISRRLLVTPAGLNGDGSRVRVDIA